MTWLWCIQLGLDIALMALVLRLRRKAEASSTEALSRRLDERAAELDRARQEFQDRARRALERLNRACARAEQWLDQGPLPGLSVSGTEEGRELSAVSAAPAEEIPSLRDIERTRHRLAAESQPNLRALLQDQLS